MLAKLCLDYSSQDQGVRDPKLDPTDCGRCWGGKVDGNRGQGLAPRVW